jgi:cell wall-associated NlpC family hydrolase
MVAACAVLGPIALTVPAAHAATPQRAVTTAQKKHKSWSQRHKIGLKAVAAARKQIGKWYRYGGAGPRMFDCSGLVQYSYRKAGVRLLRTAGQQHRQNKRHVRWQNLAVGDLVYFNYNNHTGIISKVKGHKIYMIHASRTGTRIKEVRIDNNSYYRSAFYGAVRPY